MIVFPHVNRVSLTAALYAHNAITRNIANATNVELGLDGLSDEASSPDVENIGLHATSIRQWVLQASLPDLGDGSDGELDESELHGIDDELGDLGLSGTKLNVRNHFKINLVWPVRICISAHSLYSYIFSQPCLLFLVMLTAGTRLDAWIIFECSLCVFQ